MHRRTNKHENERGNDVSRRIRRLLPALEGYLESKHRSLNTPTKTAEYEQSSSPSFTTMNYTENQIIHAQR